MGAGRENNLAISFGYLLGKFRRYVTHLRKRAAMLCRLPQIEADRFSPDMMMRCPVIERAERSVAM
jgi:hypothetical protein